MTRIRPTRFLSGLAAGALALMAANAALSQSAFSPAITVNDRVITYYEIEQRALLLAIMSTPGDVRDLAREQLIDDRLKLEAAEIAGITPSEDGVQAGIAELAQRVNLPPEEFIQALAAEGIDEETMRDFTYSGISWRGVVQSRFGAQVQISEEEIDRAIIANSGAGGVRVLLSEIVIPATPQTREEVTNLAGTLSDIRGFEAFADAARTYSAAQTKDSGGQIDWMPITNLPPQLRPLIVALGPGDISEPVQLPNAVALFQMRDIEETGRRAPSYAAIDYAMFYMSGGRSPETLARAAELRGRIDRCDDLYGVAKDLPPEVLVRASKAPGEIPHDIALELARLDDNEVSTALTTSNGQNLIFLMLCGRTAQLDEELSREDVAQALRNQRLQSFAESYLAQLRADATIVEK